MSTTAPKLKAPFPAFGGKSKVAAEVWQRLGNIRNYCEPFAFSAAVLLGRPDGAGPIETINDLNSYVANFWRAVRADPEAVAAHADWPVVEDDLHARHRWLVTSDEAQHKLNRVREDPTFYDARIAGWWAWGACCWIGSGWCDTNELRGDGQPREKMPTPEDGGRGVNGLSEKMPFIGDRTKFGRGVQAFDDGKRPQLCNGNTTAGPGVLAHVDEKRPRASSSANGWMPGVLTGPAAETHRPQLADAYARGRGVNGNDADSTCSRRRAWLTDWMMRLADRLRPVRVCCGHWSRICDSDSTLTRLGLTGVFLDPPYRKSLACGKKNRSAHIYANDKAQDVNALCDEVQAWCLKWGGDPMIRVALCGYEGEYPAIVEAGWTEWAWKSNGGYGNRSEQGRENAARERIWFSPACLNSSVPAADSLFASVA